jgi:glycerol-3-phosphate dehydrogenase
MEEFSWRTRLENIKRLSLEDFDLLIIGGGITGAGLALDAAVRGLNVAVVEKRDFAAGTSSRSTKLLHGGLRYLEHFDFAMVREGLRERATLLKIAPHLAEPFRFLIPIYEQAKRNYDHPLKMRLGLVFYDLLAGGFGLGRHQRISREDALKLAPQLEARGLKGALVYYDCRTNDSRLVIEVLKSANQHGATIANYTTVTGFIKDANGQISGAQLRDELTDELIETRAKLVINATGVWMDEVRNLDSQNQSDNKRVRPSKGIHITVSADRLRVTTAWLIPALTGHRFYFVVPWQGRVNIGTTDTDYQGNKDAPCSEANEVQEILDAINAFFPEASLQPADVISTWAGLRPLIGDPEAKSSKDVSRKEAVIEGPDGLISIAGGKLTTYRLMAERGVDLAAQRLKERFNLQAANGFPTTELVISGGEITRLEIEARAQQFTEREGLRIDTARHLLNAYGSEAQQVVEMAKQDDKLRQPMVKDLQHIFAEVVYAVRCEMALTIADVLARRTRLIVLAGNASLDCAPGVAELMAKELRWNEGEIEKQIVQFAREYEREYVVRRDSTKAGLYLSR